MKKNIRNWQWTLLTCAMLLGLGIIAAPAQSQDQGATTIQEKAAAAKEAASELGSAVGESIKEKAVDAKEVVMKEPL